MIKFVLPVFLILLLALSEQERQRTTTAEPEQLPARRAQTYLPWIRTTKIYRFCVWLFEFAVGLGTLAALLLAFLGGPFWPTDPVVLAPPPSVSYPFEVPFQIENKSGLYPINDLTITCVFDTVLLPHGNLIQDSPITAYGNNNIPPLTSAWYVCPFRPRHPSSYDRVIGAKIHFEFTYNTYWPVGRKNVSSTHYTLDTTAVPFRWLEGERLR